MIAAPTGARPGRSPVRMAIAAGVVALVVAGGLFWFRHLGSAPIENGDEAIYAVFLRNMLRGKGLVWLSWGGGQTYQRPPLALWLYAAICAPWGAAHLGERLLRVGPALAGAATLAVVYATGARAYRSRLAGALAALFLAALPTFYHFTHRVFSDPPLVLFETLALYAVVRARDDGRDRWPLLAALALGLAVATKSVAGLLPAPVIVAALASRRPRPAARVWAWGTALFLAVALPWYLAGLAHGGTEFLREHFGFNVWQRARGAIVGVGQTGPAAYLVQLWKTDGLAGRVELVLGLLAGGLLAGGGLTRHRSRDPENGARDAWLLFALWAAALLVEVSLVGTRLAQYLLPAYPGLALAAAGLVPALERRGLRRSTRVVAAGVALAAGIALALLGGLRGAALSFGTAPAPEARDFAAVLRRDPGDHRPVFVVREDPVALAYYSDRDVILVETDPDAARAMDAIDLFHDAHAVRFVPADRLELVAEDPRTASGGALVVLPDDDEPGLADKPGVRVRRLARAGGYTLALLATDRL